MSKSKELVDVTPSPEKMGVSALRQEGVVVPMQAFTKVEAKVTKLEPEDEEGPDSDTGDNIFFGDDARDGSEKVVHHPMLGPTLAITGIFGTLPVMWTYAAAMAAATPVGWAVFGGVLATEVLVWYLYARFASSHTAAHRAKLNQNVRTVHHSQTAGAIFKKRK